MEDNAATINDNSMRKSQKKQIENNLELLGKTHDAIKKALETGNGEIALTLLQQCQNSAIQIGEMIEESLGEDFATIRLLEAYCEQLYQIYETIRQQQPLNSNKACKNLNKKLIRIENSVKNDIRVRTTAVFLPYKASMWDSLESVWKAADADPDCDAYVIPIPYFDKNPDRSLKEEHYEGDQYPKYVPITRYDEFDLEACRPDVIYIHNPYDECNHVTSVHPYFYSKNLRKFTDKLVYIPYFVLNEIEPDNQAAIDGMKHFCFTPGTLYADQVIVQSENMRQIYINEYIKAAKKMGLGGEHVDRKFLEKKFLGLGSPKIDKVLNTRKEDLEIPAEWLKIIEKPDGSWKKIIFYNTGVGALLNHNEKMLVKLESVFETFKENKDEVALLWRPHPLIQATIESMRPQLWEAYKEIRDRFIAEGWGIYDDTPDMDRAIILSDAYYGDESSVVHLCKEAERPAMIQDVETLPQKGYLFPISNGIFYDGCLWFVGMNDNGIYRMDIETFEAELIQRIPWDDVSHKKNHYGRIVQYKNKFLLVPWLASQIAIFDMQKKELKHVEYTVEKCNSGSCFYDGILIDNKVFLAPSSSEKIVCINMDTEKVEYVSESLISRFNIPKGKQAFAFGGIAMNKKNVLFTMLFSDSIVKYDTKLDELSLIPIETLDDGGSGIFNGDDGYWIIHKEKKEILYYDINTLQAHVLKDFPEDYVAKADWNFHQGIVFEGDLILLPREANMCLQISIKSRDIKRIAIDTEPYSADNYWEKYSIYPSVFKVGSQLFITDYRGNCHILSQDGTIDTKKINVHYKKEEEELLESYNFEENNYYDNLVRFLRNVRNKGEL